MNSLLLRPCCVTDLVSLNNLTEHDKKLSINDDSEETLILKCMCLLLARAGHDLDIVFTPRACESSFEEKPTF